MLVKRRAKKHGFSPQLFQYKKIQLLLADRKVDFKIDNTALKKFSLVYLSNVFHYMHEAALIAEFCHLKKIPFIPAVLREARAIPKTKIHNLLACALAGLSVPKTIFLEDPEIVAPLVKKTFSFPIVAKSNCGSKGAQVFLLENEPALERFLKRKFRPKEKLSTPTYLFQEFIPADSHIRVLIVGDKVMGAVECRNDTPGEFRHNLALGGKAHQIKVTPGMKRLAVKAKEAVGYEIAGIDLIKHKETGRLYILEINRTPEFKKFTKATGIDALGEIIKLFLRFSRKPIQ